MKKNAESRANRSSKSSPQPAHEPANGFWADLREIIVPANKWHYAFHAVVILVAISYWIGSRIFLPQASWGEIIMYRPGGDNQVWPIVTALSHFNFGDPTDALKYGEGIGGFHAVILLPHAIAYAIFGGPGYMIADAVFSWCYFVAAAMLLRRWRLSLISSITLSAALSTFSLQSVLQNISEAFSRFLALFGRTMAEWDFPALFNLSIFGKRIPRPLPTEIFVVLILYFLLRQWQDSRPPSLKRGLALGVLLGLLMQGDPFSFTALGLLTVAVVARTTWLQKGKLPWRLGAGVAGGIAVVGWYFVVQMFGQHPDSAARFGLATFPRSKIYILPGYAPWLRLLLAALLAIIIQALVRRARKLLPASGPVSQRESDSANPHDPAPQLERDLNTTSALVWFALAVAAAAWLAQPLQLLLLGKGAQIYHYAFYTFPAFFAYAVVLLIICLFKALNAPARIVEASAPPSQSRVSIGVACGAALGVMFVLGVEESCTGIKYLGVSRHETTPWSAMGEAYRPNFRALDKAFRENPALKGTRSFATFCQEVNFLLTAFHNKRAFLPDNGFTTLSDRELEQRLFETSKICKMTPDTFGNMIQDWYTMNFWLGCAKYWCASDYRFGRDDDYAPGYLDALRKAPAQSPFNLVLPRSEFLRISAAYEAALTKPSDVNTYPDAVILSLLLKSHGIDIDRTLYRETYSNDVFVVYTKIAKN